MMNEAFLHFVWKYQIYNLFAKTTENLPVEVLKTGRHNTDAGPDFSNARIKIGETTWAGNVEIHIKSSDWHVHKHQEDDAYTNIILHVVFEDDQIIYDRNGNIIPTMELKGIINENVYKRYFYYINNQLWIPCEKDIVQVNQITIKGWMERLFVERMERKVQVLQTLFAHNGNSLNETFYHVLAGNFGFKTNEQPFLILSRLLPISILGKHKNSYFQIEAMLYGCSGMLNGDFKDDYPNQLLQEFKFLQKKYGLTTMESHLWKFLRLRPTNFPSIRISQLAALIYKSENLLSKILDETNVDNVKSFFNVKASAYWDDHYNFDKSSKKISKSLGENATENLILNTVVQFLFFYAKLKGEQRYRDRAIDFMFALKPEKNNIITRWALIGLDAQNALESQGLIELKNNYCKRKQCLNCAIGTSLLRESMIH